MNPLLRLKGSSGRRVTMLIASKLRPLLRLPQWGSVIFLTFFCSIQDTTTSSRVSTNQQEQNKMADKQCASMMTVSDQEDTEENAGASFNMKGASFNMKITEDANNDDDNDDDAAPAPAPADDDHDDNGEPETDVKSGVSTGHAATEAASVRIPRRAHPPTRRHGVVTFWIPSRGPICFAFLHWSSRTIRRGHSKRNR